MLCEVAEQPWAWTRAQANEPLKTLLTFDASSSTADGFNWMTAGAVLKD